MGVDSFRGGSDSRGPKNRRSDVSIQKLFNVFRRTATGGLVDDQVPPKTLTRDPGADPTVARPSGRHRQVVEQPG